MARKKPSEPQPSALPSDEGLQRCTTAAGMPAWRWGADGYPYGYDSPEQEAVAQQQARDNGRSLAELKAQVVAEA